MGLQALLRGLRWQSHGRIADDRLDGGSRPLSAPSRALRPERLLGILLVLAVLVALAVAFAFLLDPAPSPDQPSNGRDDAEVVRVVDGDTIIVRIDGREERVRFIGVDAPELANADTGQAAECGGPEARDANAALLDGAAVELERDVSDRDRFGRLLRHVWVRDSLASRRLVLEGAIEARSYPPDTGRDGELDAAERQAREQGAGIWGSC